MPGGRRLSSSTLISGVIIIFSEQKELRSALSPSRRNMMPTYGRFFIRNDSDRPIFFVPMPNIAFYARPSWRSADEGGNEPADWQTEHLDLPEGRIGPGNAVELETESTGGDSARLKFMDAEGNRWVRTSDDGQPSPVSHRSSRRSIVYQALCHLRPFEVILMKWPGRFANWRFSRMEKGIPLMARLIRFWWAVPPSARLKLGWCQPVCRMTGHTRCGRPRCASCRRTVTLLPGARLRITLLTTNDGHQVLPFGGTTASRAPVRRGGMLQKLCRH